MTDKEFAEELVNRLNRLVAESDSIREMVGRLLDVDVVGCQDCSNHPSLVVTYKSCQFRVGVMGLLNGLFETRPGVGLTGRVAACYADPDSGDDGSQHEHGKLLMFMCCTGESALI